MAAIPTISDTISIGDVAVYLSGNENAKGNFFGKKIGALITPVKIGYVTDALRWKYEGDPTNTNLRQTANYLLWMVGKYGMEAQYIISGTGGGSVIP